jgi:TetR/AcrR family acrAB operon transcriptional repressor
MEHTRELSGVRAQKLSGRRQRVADMEAGLRRAARGRPGRAPVPARQAAIAVHALLNGLISDWLQDPAAFDLQAVGRQAVDALLRGLQAPAASA